MTQAPQVPVEDVVSPVAIRAEARARRSGRPVLASIGVPLPFEDPLMLLRAGSPLTAGWWSGGGIRAAGAEVATFAEAAGPNRFGDLAASATRWFDAMESEGRAPIAFTGGSYRDERPTGAWGGYPNAATWIPELCAIRDADGTWLVASTLVFAGDAEAAAAHLVTVLSRGVDTIQQPAPDVVVRRAAALAGQRTPDDAAWHTAVDHALRRIDAGAMDKVVLARREHLDDVAEDPWAVAARMSGAYPECFSYGVHMEGRTFLGASPELLVARDGTRVRSAPAAGTTPRGGTDLETDKSRREQQLVTDAVIAALEPLCSNLRHGSAISTAAGPVEHLSTSIEGILRDARTHVLDLVTVLHPTPAVGGTPTAAAVTFQADQEGFDRGWYAGPVGIVHANGDGMLAIALRCALLHDGTADLFAGAGIVAGSTADAERDEITLKLSAAGAALR